MSSAPNEGGGTNPTPAAPATPPASPPATAAKPATAPAAAAPKPAPATPATAPAAAPKPAAAPAAKPAAPAAAKPAAAHGTDGAAGEGDELVPKIDRRGFLSSVGIGWLAFTGATVATLTGVVRFLFPNVLFEPPLQFTVGKPEEYSDGQVEEKYKEKYGVWVVRANGIIYAIISVCTHLGCTPNWLSGENKFKCPCHGSGFYKSGINFEGPAPRPLERAAISLADDGQLLVDKNRKFQQELGQWSDPASFYKPV